MVSIHVGLPAFCTRHYRAVTVLLMAVLVMAPVSAQNRSGEVGTLVSFRENFVDLLEPGGAYWNSWNESDNNPCAWAGVTCTKSLTVSELDFSGWLYVKDPDITNSLNLSMLSSLSDLTRLDLSSNVLDDIPGIDNLTRLTYLDLSSNVISELFPDGIWNLTRLEWLDISSNAITESIPHGISACRSLRFISLQQNQITGQIPSLRGLVSLQFLLLGHNNLTGTIPREIEELGSVFSLDLSSNSLSGTIPALPNMTRLGSLFLANNFLERFEEPWSLGGNVSLQRLSVSSNHLSGAIPPAVADFVNMHYLDMSLNNFSGVIPSGFSKSFPSLYIVDISQNRLIGNIPTGFLNISNGGLGPLPLFINMSHNLLSTTLGSLGEGTVDTLDLSFNNLSGPLLSNVSVLVSLYLQNNRISGDIMDAFTQSTFLQETDTISLQNNLFTGDISRMLSIDRSSSNSFWFVDLSNNKLHCSTSTAVPDPIGAILDNYNETFVFRAGGNNFSGVPAPTQCGNNYHTRLVTLDLSNSQLSGKLDREYFSGLCWPTLVVLNLSNNDISGPAPESILSIPLLTSLDLSKNNLSGPLPRPPANTTFFGPNVFAGNAGLCGYPLDSCTLPPYPGQAGIQGWVLFLVIGGSLAVAVGSCLAAAWRWKEYQKKHLQDVDLINTLLQGDSATIMPLRELRKATHNFADSAQIGEGGFGTVYVGKLTDGTLVAIKKSKREALERDKQQFLNEVRILSQVSHRNLVKLLGCCLENKTAVLVFEFVTNGTLEDHLKRKSAAPSLSWKQRLSIALQTANALNYLHTSAASPIYHRDVKSANILLDDDLDVKVADFGISKLAPLKATHVSTAAVQGTMGYIDPEYYTSYQLTEKSDVFSFGVVLLELLTSKPALDYSRGGDETSLVNLAGPHVEKGNLEGLIDPVLMETYNEVSKQGKESMIQVGRLAMTCVELRSKARPTMDEVLKELQHLWVELHSLSTAAADIDSKLAAANASDDLGDVTQEFPLLVGKSFSVDDGRVNVQVSKSGIQLSRLQGHSSKF